LGGHPCRVFPMEWIEDHEIPNPFDQYDRC
jgi:hypothetical protein